jgi:hypothetical protein
MDLIDEPSEPFGKPFRVGKRGGGLWVASGGLPAIVDQYVYHVHGSRESDVKCTEVGGKGVRERKEKEGAHSCSRRLSSPNRRERELHRG